MRPLHRGSVNKRRSARNFNRRSRRTNARNMSPNRGGWRL